MTKKRKTMMIALVAAAATVTPGTAAASPLLSGYGGPGQGSQAILGSTLLNGPGQGGGGSSGGPSASGGGSASVPGGSASSPVPNLRAATPAQSAASGAALSAGTGSSTRGPSHSTRSARAQASVPAFAGYTATQRAGAARPLLGLSTQDLLYIVLALAVLAFTGVLTARLGRRPGTGGPGGGRDPRRISSS